MTKKGGGTENEEDISTAIRRPAVAHKEAFKGKLLEWIRDLKPSESEGLVGIVLDKLGYEDVKVVGARLLGRDCSEP